MLRILLKFSKRKPYILKAFNLCQQTQKKTNRKMRALCEICRDQLFFRGSSPIAFGCGHAFHRECTVHLR